MIIIIRLSVMLCAAGTTLGGTTMQRVGWLDRAVDYCRRHFLNDVQKLQPMQLQASMETVPAGYVDSRAWDYASVSRLLSLLGASETAAPVRLALQHALHPPLHTRRFISKQQSWKLFPSLAKGHANEIYYDFESGSHEGEEISGAGVASELQDDAVVVLQNPVEAHLPSGRISVKLLRDILESRALAARNMPGSTRSTIPWILKNTTSVTTQAVQRTVAATATEIDITVSGGDDSGGATNITTTGGATNTTTTGGATTTTTTGGATNTTTTGSAGASDKGGDETSGGDKPLVKPSIFSLSMPLAAAPAAVPAAVPAADGTTTAAKTTRSRRIRPDHPENSRF